MKTLQQLIPPSERLASRGIDAPDAVTGIVTRADAVTPGSLFFALKGSQADGHDFVAEALARGAAAVVVERADRMPSAGGALLVASTRESLGRAASRWYGDPSTSFDLVGVTGTNGKTTTAFLLRQLWDALGKTSGLFGTVEYRIGQEHFDSALTTPDPLSLQALFARLRDAKGTVAAMEVSSIALDQRRVAGTRFAVGVFTNLTQDHLDYHGDMETYYASKRKFFVDYALPVAVLNADDPFTERLRAETTAPRVLTWSVEGRRDADLSVSEAAFRKEGTTARLETPNGPVTVETGLIGRHNLSNLVGALTAALALGEDVKDAAAALVRAPGAPGRLERVRSTSGSGPHVFVDYAHTDDALDNVLRALSAVREEGGGQGRIVTVFGCGGDRDRGKRPKMAAVASRGSDVTVATSDNPRTEDPERILDDVEHGIDREATEYHRVVDRRAAIGLALQLAGPEDLVLIAGKGHETYQILGRSKVPFDDREIVRDHFMTR